MINRWKISSKLAALGGVVLIAILILEVSYVSSIWQQRNFRAQEQIGVKQIAPLYPLYHHLLTIRDSASFFLYSKAILNTENESLLVDLTRLESESNQLLKPLERSIKEGSYSQKVSQQIEEVIAEWQRLQGEWREMDISSIRLAQQPNEEEDNDDEEEDYSSEEEEMEEESDEFSEDDSEEESEETVERTVVEQYQFSFNQLITSLKMVMVTMGEETNLVIDPDLDSLYLIDLLLHHTPNVTNAASIARGQSASSLVKKSMTFSERSELGLYYGQFRLLQEQVNESLTKAYQNNALLEPRLSSMQTAFNQTLSQFSDSIEALVKTEEEDSPVFELLGSKTLFDEGTRAIDAAFELHQATLTEVDKLLQQAVSAQEQTVYTILALSLLLIVLLIVGSLSLVRSIIRPIDGLMNTMTETTKSGDFSYRIKGEYVSFNNEIGLMSQSYNRLMDLLQRGISDANQVVGAIARGDFEHRMTGDAEGDLATLKEGVNGSADSVENTMNALSMVMKGLGEGNLSVRMGSDVEEHFRNQVNHAMESIDTVLKQVGEIIKQQAMGNFAARITVEAQGDLATLAENVNRAMGDLQSAIQEVVVTANRIGEGDLTQEIESDYHGALGTLKDAINATQNNLARTVSQVRASSHQVKTGSAAISKGSQELSDRTSQQAASLEETAASMEEMSGTVTMNADNAAQASQLAADSLQKAEGGAAIVSKVVESMEGINDSSSKIADIITLIDWIAFQTNLLALNAAVEAARAGEHGRGFAVVATEVRSLAQRSADAAKEIKVLIEDSTSRIEEGSNFAQQSGDALDMIQDSVKKVNDIAGEIAAAAQEQTLGIGQVNNAISQLDGVTQQNSTLVEKTASSSTELSLQADNLAEIAGLFKLGQTIGER